MRHLISALFLAILFALPARAEGDIKLADLAWMEGHWVMEGDQGKAEEIWMAPLGNHCRFVPLGVPQRFCCYGVSVI